MTMMMRRALPLLAVAAGALGVTACGSSSSTSSSGSGATAGSSSTSAATSSSTSSGSSSYAAQQLAKGREVPAAPVPTTPIKNLAAFKGKTIYYIPIGADVPAFAVTAQNMKTAAAKIGVKVVECNGNFNPTGWTNCFAQAINSNPAAIVTDSIPYQLLQKQIVAAAAKGIGVYVTDQIPFAGAPSGSHVAFLQPNPAQYTLPMDWVINDSQGKADILLLEATDAATSKIGTQVNALGELKKHCPACKETIVKFTNSNENQLPSLVSSALLKDPNIKYVFAEYDQYTQFVQQGIQQANKTSQITIVAGAAALSGLQSVKTGTLVKAEAANNQAYNGWFNVDEALRLANGQPAFKYHWPVRLFDSSNIGSISLTDGAQSSGAWFGSSSYQQKYAKLWGAS